MTDLVELIRRLLPSVGPWLVGVAGPVAVGKTTIARHIAAELGSAVVSTDAFLFSNAVLGARRLELRKGFPETYDTEGIQRTLGRLRAGQTADVPVYSHRTYDIVEGASSTIVPPVVVEGVVALQEPARSFLDVAVYVDAPQAVVRDWFVSRFVRLADEARVDETSFYHGFASLDEERVAEIAQMTWDAINAVNLDQHIAPSRDAADVLIEKAPDHSIAKITHVER